MASSWKTAISVAARPVRDRESLSAQGSERGLPTILYVCGHSNVVEGGVSMGNKTDYSATGSGLPGMAMCA